MPDHTKAYNKKVERRIKLLLKNGYSTNEILEITGTSRSTITKYKPKKRFYQCITR